MNRRPPPAPPRPDLERQPDGAFGWLQAELLHDGWLAEIGPHATAVLVLLALAADRRGSSFFSRERIAVALGISRHEVDVTLQLLLVKGRANGTASGSGKRDHLVKVFAGARA